MITALAALLSKPFGRAIGLMLVGIVGGILIWSFLHKPDAAPRVTARALLTNISYVQELDLVSHFYDEIMFVGDALEQERLADQASEDTLAARAALENAQIDMINQQDIVDDSSASLTEHSNSLSYANHRVDSALSAKRNLPGTFSAFEKAVINDSSRFPLRFYKKLKEVEAAELLVKNSVNRPKVLWSTIRKKSKHYLKYQMYLLKQTEFRVAYQEEKEILKRAIQNSRKYRDQIRKGKENCEKELNKVKRKFTRFQQDYLNAKENFLELRRQAKVSREKAVAARNAAKEDINLNDPQLLAIVPTTVTGYLDMNDVVWDTAGSDTVQVMINEIRLSRVYIDLDEIESFAIGKKNPDISFKKGGLYYQVFVQMKQEMDDMRERVRIRARRNGIEQQTAEMACDYFESLFGTFGLPVSISFPNHPQCNCGSQLVPRIKSDLEPEPKVSDSTGIASRDTSLSTAVNTAGISGGF